MTRFAFGSRLENEVRVWCERLMRLVSVAESSAGEAGLRLGLGMGVAEFEKSGWGLRLGLGLGGRKAKG